MRRLAHLAEPTPPAVADLIAAASPATLLVLPKPYASSAAVAARGGARTVCLRSSVADDGLSRVFEEATAHAIKWKKACPTRRPQSWMGSVGTSSRRKSFLGAQASSPPAAVAAAEHPLTLPPRTDRPLDVVLHFVHEQPPTAPTMRPRAGSSTGQPSPPSSFRPAHARQSQSVNLQGMLSSAFLVTTASLPFLAARSSSALSSSSSSTLRRPAKAVLGSRSGSLHSSSSAASLANLPSSTSPDPARSLRGMLGSPPDAVLIHVLPDGGPPLLPHLLDSFVQTFVASTPSVLLAVVPASLLAAHPAVHHDPPLSANSTMTARPTPTIFQLLLASAIRPPLPPLPSAAARSRRGSSSSVQSLRSSASGLSSKPTEDLHTFIATASDVSYVPSPTPGYPSSSTSATAPPTPTTVVTPPSPSTAAFDPRPGAHMPVPDLVASSSSSASSATDETSLPPASAADAKSLRARNSFGSFSTAGGGGERKRRKGGFWSRILGRKADRDGGTTAVSA